MKSAFTNPEPCAHLTVYKQSHGLDAYQSLQSHLTTTPNGRTALGRPQSPIPRCGFCSLRPSRLYLCLLCPSFTCADHAAIHSRSNSGHEIAVDIDRTELFCFLCADQVYDPEFDAFVVVRRFKELPKSLGSSHGRKRRPAISAELIIGTGLEAKSLSREGWGLRGLNNLGSTCFMNSVLQALLHAPPLRNYFLNGQHDWQVCGQKRRRSRRFRGKGTEEASCLACSVSGVFAEVFSGDRTPYSPAQFLYSWWQHSSNLAGYEQQDAHEFFISVLNSIHEREHAHLNKVAGDCRCIAHRAFSGLLRSDITCAVCGFTSTTYDPCIDISLDLEPCTCVKANDNSRTSTLMGCLDLFTRPEKLSFDQKPYCQNCEASQDSMKQMSIRRLPLVLCFHMKRFEHSMSRGTSRKINEHLQFPFSLDMMPYLSSSIIRSRFGNRIFAFEGDELETSSETSSEFEVFAVVTHIGILESGHYVTYLRLHDKWYKCDDAWITQVSEGTVRASQGYMIYYAQKHRK